MKAAEPMPRGMRGKRAARPPCGPRPRCYPPRMSITAIVENDTVKLPVHVPDGTRVEITLPEQSARVGEGEETLFDVLKDFIGKAEGLPEDFAAEHDHYIHGTPKRSAK